MKGTRLLIMKGTRPLKGPALTNDLCSQYLKIKVKTAFFLTLTLTF